MQQATDLHKLAAEDQKQGQRLERMQKMAVQVQHWLELAQVADSRLSVACRACDSASTLELLDVISKNKAISAFSYMSTSSASDAIRSAGLAIQTLVEALPRHAQQASIDLPDDLLDFAVDLTFNPGFEVLSWFNMMHLNDASRQCHQAVGRLRPLLDRLTRLAADTSAKVRQELEGTTKALKRPTLKLLRPRCSMRCGCPRRAASLYLMENVGSTRSTRSSRRARRWVALRCWRASMWM